MIKEIHRSNITKYSNLLELDYKRYISLTAVIRRYISLKGIKSEMTRKKRLVTRKTCNLESIANPLLALAEEFLLLPDTFLQQKQCHLKRYH